MQFQRRALGAKDVAIRLRYCGVCHSDIHTVRGDWGPVQYPLIVGHELAGEVVAVGSSVSKSRVGSRVGVGTMVNSCRRCSACDAGHENYCLNGNTQTYGVIGIKGSPAYTAAKHGVIGLTRAAALDYAAQNIRVNAICPGYIDTPMMGRFTGGTSEGRQRVISEEPIGRMGRPEEIAATVVWMCSGEAPS